MVRLRMKFLSLYQGTALRRIRSNRKHLVKCKFALFPGSCLCNLEFCITGCKTIYGKRQWSHNNSINWKLQPIAQSFMIIALSRGRNLFLSKISNQTDHICNSHPKVILILQIIKTESIRL